MPEDRMEEVTPSTDFLEVEQTIYAPNDAWLETVEVSEPELSGTVPQMTGGCKVG